MQKCFFLKGGELVLSSSISFSTFSPHIVPCQKRECSRGITIWEHSPDNTDFWGLTYSGFTAMYKASKAYRLLEALKVSGCDLIFLEINQLEYECKSVFSLVSEVWSSCFWGKFLMFQRRK